MNCGIVCGTVTAADVFWLTEWPVHASHTNASLVLTHSSARSLSANRNDCISMSKPSFITGQRHPTTDVWSNGSAESLTALVALLYVYSIHCLYASLIHQMFDLSHRLVVIYFCQSIICIHEINISSATMPNTTNTQQECIHSHMAVCLKHDGIDNTPRLHVSHF